MAFNIRALALAAFCASATTGRTNLLLVYADDSNEALVFSNGIDDKAAAQLDSQTPSQPACYMWSNPGEAGESGGGGTVPWPIEHSASACASGGHQPLTKIENSYLLQSRHATLDYLAASGASVAESTLDERTWVCPEDDDDGIGAGAGTAAHSSGATTPTLRTRWLVRNSSSGPVSVGWVNTDNSAEVSVFDDSISPAQADPRTIIQPGGFLSVEGHHGHIFHVRELLLPGGDGGDGVGGGFSQGRVLLRHRPGLTPIRNRADAPCPVQDEMHDEDEDDGHGDEDNEDDHDEKSGNTSCNVLYKDFVNRAGCPVDVYYAGVSPLPSDGDGGRAALASVANALQMAGSLSSPTCKETLAFHLGVDPNPTDYQKDWDSAVRSEVTYLTHRFVARYHHDPTVVVDEFVVDADVVRDCPSKKQPAEVARIKVGEGVSAEVGRKDDEEEEDVDDAIDRQANEFGAVMGNENNIIIDNNAHNNNNATVAVLLGNSGITLPSSADSLGWGGGARSEL